MVKEFAAVHNTAQIRKLLTVLGRDFALSKNPNYKKGGLIGLAAIAVALGKVTVYLYICVLSGLSSIRYDQVSNCVVS